MYCTRKITDSIHWVGGNDRRLALFENLFPIPNGVSYNSYVILDEKTVLMDTADPSIRSQFLENVQHVLNVRLPPAAGEPRIPAERNASGLSGHQPHGARSLLRNCRYPRPASRS